MNTYREVFIAIIRWAMIIVASHLVERGIITPEQSDALATQVALTALGGLFFIIPLVWKWLSVKYNLNFLEAALEANPEDTTLEEVKKAVSKTSDFGTK